MLLIFRINAFYYYLDNKNIKVAEMPSLLEYLSQYAYYHQDRRNIMTHFVGIPMIVVALAILLSRPSIALFGISLTPAMLIACACGIFYLSLNKMLGVVMSVLLLLVIVVADYVSKQGTLVWLVTGVGLFVVGWLFQLIGHFFEGKKPAFIDDVVGLIIGPLFVLVELMFMLGMKPDWQASIDQYCKQKNSKTKDLNG